MSRTAKRAAAAAQASLDNGNPSFKVLSVMELDGGTKRYTIQLPLTAAYLWFSGSPAFPVYIGSRLTKFGRSLDCALSTIDGYEPHFTVDSSTVLALDIEPNAQDGPLFGLRNQTYGLPQEACLTIQRTIALHGTPLRWALEVVRRVI